MPIQIKGHEDKNKKYIGKDRIKYRVSIYDLKVYFRGHGCLYFQVFISKDGSENEIYYTSLFPSKIAFYLKFANNRGNSKTYTIPFVKLEQTGNELESVCKRFADEMIHQGSGLGQIVSRTIDADGLKSVQNIHVNVDNDDSNYDVLKRITSGDVVVYGSFGDNQPQYPIDWGDNFAVDVKD